MVREHHTMSESSLHERVLPSAPRLNYSCSVLFTSRCTYDHRNKSHIVVIRLFSRRSYMSLTTA